MAVYQLSIFLENKKGQLAEITSLLAENSVNMKALNIAETADYGVLRIIADDTRKAANILSSNGYIVDPTPVAVIMVPDEPGGLNNVLQVLAKNDIDIEYMYSVFGNKNGLACMVFRVSDIDKFNTIAKANKIVIVDNKDLDIK